MAKKADLESAHRQHDDLCRQAAAAEAARDYREALQRAEASLPTMRDAVAYQRRFLKIAQPPLPAADRILRLAPPVFTRRPLDALETCLQGWTRAARSAYPHLPDQLAAARQTLAAAVRLWSELSTAVAAPWRLPGKDRTAAGLVEAWAALGLVVRSGPSGAVGYKVVTDLRRDAVGKCSGCGCLRQASAVQLLELMACPSCHERHSFVIVRRVL